MNSSGHETKWGWIKKLNLTQCATWLILTNEKMSNHNSSQKRTFTILFHFTSSLQNHPRHVSFDIYCNLTSRVMRVLESFKLCLTTSFITHRFPWLWINKLTPHSYREFNPEELTKWLHRSKDVLAEFCVHRSPVWSEVWFNTSTNLSKAALQNLSFANLSTSSWFWVAVLGLSRGWKLCCVRFGPHGEAWGRQAPVICRSMWKGHVLRFP